MIFFYQTNDLARESVPGSVQFGVDQLSIYADFKLPAVSRDEFEGFDVLFEFLDDFCHQTDGAICVVSNSAVNQFKLHCGSLSWLALSIH